MIEFAEHPGYFGIFTRNQADGAYPNGSQVRKAFSQEGDGTPTGTLGIVLGSISAPDVGIGYFVEWNNRPKVAVFVMEAKVERATGT